MASEIVKWIVCRGLLKDSETAAHMALWLEYFAMQKMGRTAALENMHLYVKLTTLVSYLLHKEWRNTYGCGIPAMLCKSPWTLIA